MSQVRRQPAAMEVRPFLHLRLLGWLGLVIAVVFLLSGLVLITQGKALGALLLAPGVAGFAMNRLG